MSSDLERSHYISGQGRRLWVGPRGNRNSDKAGDQSTGMGTTLPPQEQKRSLAHMSSRKHPPLEARGSQPHQLISETAWGIELEKYFFIFLRFLAFSNTLGVSLLPYPEMHSLPCSWIMVPLVLCPWMTLLSSMHHTVAVLIWTRARHRPWPSRFNLD